MRIGEGALTTDVVRPFVPGGKDFALSKRFYQALGFTLEFEAPQIAGFSSDSGAFLLQDFYDEGWAGNFMMQAMVHDLDAWWAHIQSLDLPRNFGVPEPKAPARQPWGLTIAYVIDPGGVLWHFAQKTD